MVNEYYKCLRKALYMIANGDGHPTFQEIEAIRDEVTKGIQLHEADYYGAVGVPEEYVDMLNRLPMTRVEQHMTLSNVGLLYNKHFTVSDGTVMIRRKIDTPEKDGLIYADTLEKAPYDKLDTYGKRQFEEYTALVDKFMATHDEVKGYSVGIASSIFDSPPATCCVEHVRLAPTDSDKGILEVPIYKVANGMYVKEGGKLSGGIHPYYVAGDTKDKNRPYLFYWVGRTQYFHRLFHKDELTIRDYVIRGHK